MKNGLLILAAALLAGCTSFRPTQKDAFVDGNGEVLLVEYGEASRPYTYTLVSPMNGAELECTDTKMVRLTMPNGKRLLCYICQNVSPKGTMYETRDKKWKYLTIGLASRLYIERPEIRDYELYFEGTICPSALDEVRR